MLFVQVHFWPYIQPCQRLRSLFHSLLLYKVLLLCTLNFLDCSLVRGLSHQRIKVILHPLVVFGALLLVGHSLSWNRLSSLPPFVRQTKRSAPFALVLSTRGAIA